MSGLRGGARSLKPEAAKIRTRRRRLARNAALLERPRRGALDDRSGALEPFALELPPRGQAALSVCVWEVSLGGPVEEILQNF